MENLFDQISNISKASAYDILVKDHATVSYDLRILKNLVRELIETPHISESDFPANDDERELYRKISTILKKL